MVQEVTTALTVVFQTVASAWNLESLAWARMKGTSASGANSRFKIHQKAEPTKIVLAFKKFNSWQHHEKTFKEIHTI